MLNLFHSDVDELDWVEFLTDLELRFAIRPSAVPCSNPTMEEVIGWFVEPAVNETIHSDKRTLVAHASDEGKATPLLFDHTFREVMRLTREEAHRLRHPYLGTGHLLLGLIRDSPGAPVAILRGLTLDIAAITAEIVRRSPPSDGAISRGLFQTPPFRKALQAAMAEARHLGDSHVRAEHLLMGMLEDEGDIASVVLEHFKPGCVGSIRAQTLKHLGYGVGDVLLGWNDGAMGKLASAVKEAVRWDHLAVLADALEEAGCTNAAILSHLRTPLHHGDRCRILDLFYLAPSQLDNRA
jgi:ATP-dependent Clp protease ATP-binding subunit ClpC